MNLLHLSRTFSLLPTKDAENEREEEVFADLLGDGKDGLKWTDLHENPLTVVLGEAGIGKTAEFRLEVSRLTTDESHAFFIPLNQLTDGGSWKVALAGAGPTFEFWKVGRDTAFVFLDSVDESRLTNHAAFIKALGLVRQALEPHLDRVQVVISSRATDWTAGVKEAIRLQLSEPIAAALAARQARVGSLESANSEASPVPTPTIQVETAEPLVVCLDPLSDEDARRCALEFGVKDETSFWDAVEDGDYGYMASRPLDLRWMVQLWNNRRSLGNYLELIEANIAYRLKEVNESYESAGVVLSVDELKAGVTELAAVAEFSGKAFFLTDCSMEPSTVELAPDKVLPKWKPEELRRLLATAVFDESSFSRVRFHHRSIREFLAAKWVAAQLKNGAPLGGFKRLFASVQHGIEVVVESRRASLSWLAAIDVDARDWVVRSFPELLLVGGDPQAWDRLSVDKAFSNLMQKTKSGLQIGWICSPSEYLRAGKSVSAGLVAEALRDPTLPHQARAACHYIAAVSRLSDCAGVSFDIYRDAGRTEWERTVALNTLERVGTEDHRKDVLRDIEKGALKINELIASALPVAPWQSLSSKRWSHIVELTEGEDRFGSGPMSRTIKRDILPQSEVAQAAALLTGLMATLPEPKDGAPPFARFEDVEFTARPWVANVLSDTFTRLLEQMPRDSDEFTSLCMEAAERIETQVYAGLTDKDEFGRLYRAIHAHNALRFKIALAILQSDDIRVTASRPVWHDRSVVSFLIEDLPEITRRANDASTAKETRHLWFSVAVQLIQARCSSREKVEVLRTLLSGVDQEQRTQAIAEQYTSMRSARQRRRRMDAKSHERTLTSRQHHDEYKTRLLAEIGGLSDGSNTVDLENLLRYALSRGTVRDEERVELDAITAGYGPEISEAWSEGVAAFWPRLNIPSPVQARTTGYPGGVLLALAGISLSLVDENAIAQLEPSQVRVAAKAASWASRTPPLWFSALARAHRDTVQACLEPWLFEEFEASDENHLGSSALNMVSRCPSEVRAMLLASIANAIISVNRSSDKKALLVIEKAVEDGTLSSAQIEVFCRRAVIESIAQDGRVGALSWLKIWMNSDAEHAWDWYKHHLSTLAHNMLGEELRAFCLEFDAMRWLTREPLPIDTTIAVQIHAVLNKYISSLPAPDEFERQVNLSIFRLCDEIPKVLTWVRGVKGHEALLSLQSVSSDSERHAISGYMIEHAALDAAQELEQAPVDPRTLSSPFALAPTTEVGLFLQAIARLEEVRKSLEEGPFSENGLFPPGIPEKHLQSWLAEKLRSTQNARFSVHREEQVFDDKKTDIQVSASQFNVCIEIKPVDTSRPYSANSLKLTLQQQIVDKYLKGYNSSRGILVLLKLDNKTWEVPGLGSGRTFDELVAYLDGEATAIKRNSKGVNELIVFPMRCA